MAMGLSAMAEKSFRHVGGDFLGMGIIEVVSRHVGTIDCDSEWLNMGGEDLGQLAWSSDPLTSVMVTVVFVKVGVDKIWFV